MLRYSISALLLILCFSAALPAATASLSGNHSGALPINPVNPERNTVVATKGLLLRSQPHAGGAVITGVPFGKVVDVFDPCDYGRMTLTTYRNYYRHQEAGSRVEYDDQAVAGNWVRVKYGRDTGYVFDAYLSEHFTPPTVFDDDANEIEPDLVLLEPGRDNRHAVYHPGKYIFYGVYDAGPGMMALRRADVSYFVAADALMVGARPGRDLLFIIGSKAPLRPHVFAARDFTKHSLIYSGDASQKVAEIPGLEVELPGVDTYAEGPSILAATADGPVTLSPPNPYAEAVTYDGSGDIDGDGQIDYRLRYHIGRSSRAVVFLSSLAYRGTASGIHPGKE